MIRNAQQIRDPLWARYDQEGPPNWSAAMGGVLYHGISHAAALDYLAKSEIHTAFCAVGRCLWPGRSGPWLSYSVDRLDRQRDTRVRERPWPWCLGDEVVFVVTGKCGLTMVDVELGDEMEARLYVEVGTTEESQSWESFAAKVEQWVGFEIGPMARQVDDRLQPPRSWSPHQAIPKEFVPTTDHLGARSST